MPFSQRNHRASALSHYRNTVVRLWVHTLASLKAQLASTVQVPNQATYDVFTSAYMTEVGVVGGCV